MRHEQNNDKFAKEHTIPMSLETRTRVDSPYVSGLKHTVNSKEVGSIDESSEHWCWCW
jgi:hypothetical protein